ncbi:hypothetical protein RJ641_031622 [Dillenia turbinata]|uniref:Uncharacterized protein n=1 Tax=Dillenia turbinata TaxID=194707 RepID=A0AAN8ZER4_9MAGN
MLSLRTLSARWLVSISPPACSSSTSKVLVCNFDRALSTQLNQKMAEKSHDNQVPKVPPSSRWSSIPNWLKLTVGSLALLLPFSSTNWQNLIKIEGGVEKVAEEVETVAEVVEKVAGVTDKVSSALADGLTLDGPLKDAALLVKKVEEIKQEVDSMVESGINNPNGSPEKKGN